MKHREGEFERAWRDENEVFRGIRQLAAFIWYYFLLLFERERELIEVNR